MHQPIILRKRPLTKYIKKKTAERSIKNTFAEYFLVQINNYKQLTDKL